MEFPGGTTEEVEMRKHSGDLTAVAAIVAGALGSSVLYRAAHRPVILTAVVGERGLTLPDVTVPEPRPPGGDVVRFVAVEPAGSVVLVRPGVPDRPVVRGTEIALENGVFEGSFRVRDPSRQIRLSVEVLHHGRAVSMGTVTALSPRIEVAGDGIRFFGF
jgi:hypothetical protein